MNFIKYKFLNFEKINKVFIPQDLKNYFTQLKKTESIYNEKLFRFYTLKEFKDISQELMYFGGVPNYNNIKNTLYEFQSYFVFADYMFHMFTYAIKLYPENSEKNEVIIICGDKYKKIANSFSEFNDLYFNESIELHFDEEGDKVPH